MIVLKVMTARRRMMPYVREVITTMKIILAILITVVLPTNITVAGIFGIIVISQRQNLRSVVTYAMIVGLNPQEMEVLKRNLITSNT